MTEPTIEQDRHRLEQFANIAERMAGDSWTFIASDEGTEILSLRSTGEEVSIGMISAEALPDELEVITCALENLLLLFRTRARAVEQVRRLQAAAGQGKPAPPAETTPQPEGREGDYAANAAMTLNERPFWRFLEETTAGGPVRDRDAADARLKRELAIKSKADLNKDGRAKAAWLNLRGSYQLWKRGLR